VNDVPLLYIPRHERTAYHHSIYTDDLHIPLQLEGTTSYFVTRPATWAEINNDKDYTHIHLTSELPLDPNDPESGERGQIVQSVALDSQAKIISKIQRSMAPAGLDIKSLCVGLEYFSLFD